MLFSKVIKQSNSWVTNPGVKFSLGPLGSQQKKDPQDGMSETNQSHVGRLVLGHPDQLIQSPPTGAGGLRHTRGEAPRG